LTTASEIPDPDAAVANVQGGQLQDGTSVSDDDGAAARLFCPSVIPLLPTATTRRREY
jgi:hypothetical protein